MGVQYQFAKRYQNFFGFDLRSNDLEFPEQRATDVNNIQFTPTGTIEKRVGFQPHADTGAKFGIFAYNRVNSSGVEVQEVLGASNTIEKLLHATFTVTYSGVNPVAQVQIAFDVASNQYRCLVVEGTNTLLDYALGLGRDEVSPITLANLKTQIDAIAGGNFLATITGSTSVPAAFLKTVPLADLTAGPVETNAAYWSSINSSSATPLAGSETNKNDLNFENVSSVQLQNCIYFANGYNPILKYDGQNLYRAGVPSASSVTAAGTAGANVYVYRSQYVQTDNAGNVIEGNLTNSPQYSFTEPSVNNVTVTVQSILAGSGFNTNCALISAIGTGTAIPVTIGHTIKAGDTAFLYNTATSNYETRSVVSVGATTVTVDSSISYTSSTTNSRNVISNNLRIRIFRNQNTGITPTLFFEIIDIPNNSLSAGTQTYVDALSDASLLSNIQLVEPVTDRSPPVAGKYISSFQNLLVTAGDPSNPNVVSVSDIENPEYFPVPDNQFTVNNLQGDVITGLHPSNENFLIFQNRAIHAMTGDVPNANFRVDTITTDIGCISHATIQDVRGAVCFLSPVGPRVMTGASIPRGLGAAKDNQLNSRIDPLFNQRGVEETKLLRGKRAIGLNDRKNERYLVFIPAETEVSGTRYTNENSVTIVYDYTRDAWVKWSNIDATGGMVTTENDTELLFIERRDADPTSGISIENYLYRFFNSGTYFDYQDHDEPIEIFYKSPWEFMGEAGILKNFNRIKVYSAELLDSPFTLDIETEKDFVPDAPISMCSLEFGSVGYGESAYGIESYGDPSTAGLKHKLSNGRAISLRVILKNSEAQTNIAITGYELEMALPYKPGFKV